MYVKISNHLVESDNFEHFWKNPFLKIFTSVLTHFVWGKIDFEIFNFLDESEDSEHFSKNNGKNYAIVMEKSDQIWSFFSITIGQILSYDKTFFHYNRTNFKFYHMKKQRKKFFFSNFMRVEKGSINEKRLFYISLESVWCASTV